MDLSGIDFPLKRPDGGYLGMTSLEEQDWCRRYAMSSFSGEGALVELGTFLGSLTLSFADGLREAVAQGLIQKEQACIHAYDLFYWHRSMVEAVEDSPLEGRIEEGEWFFEAFRENTAHVADFIEVTWGDLGKQSWKGGPIEFLLLDCLKYDAVTNNVVTTFLPATRPGLSRIGHQDYFHFYEWWTHLITFEQRAYLSIDEVIPQSGMLIMKVQKDLGTYCSQYDSNRNFKETPAELIEAAYAWNFSVIAPQYHAPLQAARIWAYLWTGKPQIARKLFDETQAQYGNTDAYERMTAYCEAEGYRF